MDAAKRSHTPRGSTKRGEENSKPRTLSIQPINKGTPTTDFFGPTFSSAEDTTTSHDRSSRVPPTRHIDSRASYGCNAVVSSRRRPKQDTESSTTLPSDAGLLLPATSRRATERKRVVTPVVGTGYDSATEKISRGFMGQTRPRTPMAHRARSTSPDFRVAPGVWLGAGRPRTREGSCRAGVCNSPLANSPLSRHESHTRGNMGRSQDNFLFTETSRPSEKSRLLGFKKMNRSTVREACEELIGMATEERKGRAVSLEDVLDIWDETIDVLREIKSEWEQIDDTNDLKLFVNLASTRGSISRDVVPANKGDDEKPLPKLSSGYSADASLKTKLSIGRRAVKRRLSWQFVDSSLLVDDQDDDTQIGEIKTPDAKAATRLMTHW